MNLRIFVCCSALLLLATRAVAEEKSPWVIADKVDGKESAQISYTRPDEGESSSNVLAGISYHFKRSRSDPGAPTPLDFHIGVGLERNTLADAKADTRFAEIGLATRLYYDGPGFWWQPEATVTYNDDREKDTRGYVGRWKNQLSGPAFFDMGFYPIGNLGFVQAYNDFGLYYDRSRVENSDAWARAWGAYVEVGLTWIPPLPTGRLGFNAQYGAARDASISGDRERRSTQYRSAGISLYLTEKKDRKNDNSIPRLTWQWYSGADHLSDKGKAKYQQLTLEYRFN